ncbi:protein kinase [Streptomyces sp. NPDC020801]|uniref:serine/threonine-protein kinase n=1 Tax=Streptomyces sp. NPDC020801 TaxID=3365093 RepID=UPI00379AD67C
MGEVFAGRYELADPIGRGGVGAVWRAWDHRRRRYVAAKVLQQRDAHSLLRFVREQALRIDHPHVLAPASWAADDDKVLFTMDLVTGGSLVHLIGDYGPLPPAFVCTLLDQLLSGLAAVHAEGVVHRDIKPANVLLEATGTGRPRLRLSDFGIAMRLGEPRLTETNLVVGTPGYLAPEQMMGAEPDFPADLFAVGLVALYLLQGAKPDAKALVEYFAERGTPGAPEGVPEPLWQVAAMLLQPDPEARFRTATGARKALAAAAELLPEPGPDDELIEVFDQLGPLPPGFGPEGPLKRSPGVAAGAAAGTTRAGSVERTGASRTDGTGTPDGGRTPNGGRTPGDGGTPGDGEARARSYTGSRASSRDSGVSPAPAPLVPAPPVPAHADTGPVAAGSGAGSAGSGAGSAASAPGSGASDPGSVSSDPGSVTSDPGSVSSDPRLDLHLGLRGDPRWPEPGAAQATGAAPPPGRPDRATGPQQASGPAQPSTMSDTGSFHLPPPQAGVSPYDTTRVPASPGPASPGPLAPATRQGAEAVTASYTAQVPQAPPSAPAQRTSRHRAVRAPRPGPPAKVAVPLLLLALACYAVGFWALTRM